MEPVRHHIDEASLAGRNGQRRIQVGHAERACLERRADELANLFGLDRQTLIDRPDGGLKRLGIEPQESTLLERQ